MNNLKFTKTHEWLKEENNEVVMGISEHAQELLGDMVFVELPTIGQHFTAGSELGVVESVKAASDFYSPISGEVIAVNQAVLKDPALVNSNPYDHGWLVKLKPSSPEELNELLSEEQYQHILAEE